MPHYSLYHLNRCSGHIDRVEVINAADDVRAVAIVRDRDRETAVELWQEGRKVLRLEGAGPAFDQAEPGSFRSALAS